VLMDAAVHRIPTTLRTIPRDSPRFLERYQKEVMRPGLINAVGTEPFVDYDSYEFLGTISFGTPPQPFLVEFKWNTNDLWVMGPEAEVDSVDGYPPKHRFLGNHSSTYVDTGVRFTNFYGDAGGELANDTLTFGAAQIPVTFGVADVVADTYAYDWVEGEMGMSIAPNASAPLNQILQNLNAPIISIYLNRNWNDSINGTGQLTLGDVDTTNCYPDYAYAPTTSTDDWQIMVDSLSYGNLTQNVSRNVFVFKYTNWLTATKSVADFIAGVFGATYNSTSTFYELGCDQVANQQDTRINMNMAGGSKAAELTINEFAEQNVDSNDPNACLLGMRGTMREDKPGSMVVGTNFLSKHCISMNLATRQMGIGNI